MKSKIKHIVVIIWISMLSIVKGQDFFVNDPFLYIHKLDRGYKLGTKNAFFDDFPFSKMIHHLGNAHYLIQKVDGSTDIINNRLETVAKDVEKAFSNEMFIYWQKNNNWFLFDGSSVSESFDSILVKKNYGILYKNKLQGIVNFKETTKDILPPIYDKVGPYYEGYLVIKNKLLGWVGKHNKIEIAYDHIYKVRPSIIAAKNNKGTTYYNSLRNQTLVKQPF